MIMLFNIVYQFGDALSFLLLSAIGLAVIFGMMKIINLAHGEFITVGAYGTVVSGKILHLPLPIAMAFGVLVTILFGLILEKLIIRHLYGRPLDSVVATWGISLIVSQSFLVIFGPSYEGLQTPMGNFKLGDYSYSEYRVFLIFFSLSLLFLLYILFMKTSFGALARATIEKPEIASSMGVNVNNIYSITFAIGAGLAGVTGALYAPTMTIVPSIGQAFIVSAFITVVSAGASPFIGLVPAAAFLSTVQTSVTFFYKATIGIIALLFSVIIIIRFLPKGFSGLISKQK
ncbi:MAG: branched-chain amino acid ABC transporter permease [Pelagibacteraceae bacterium]|jgi:urea ABC transporter permease protein UrtB|nr:branched-chain amino acid ABC transporter permease [Pelagibacteraceae bacterium]|tara:strand:+ start:941 stop:1804 length:864 start_codon:yes stop_codon:yes gene_type:complete